EERLNTCAAKRGIGVQVERIVLGARNENNKTYYFDTLLNRLFYHRFFQEQIKQLNQVITPLQSLLTIKAYIIEICDIDLAKKTSVKITDLLVDDNLQNVQFRKYITVYLQKELIIDCSTCQFTEDEMILYIIVALGSDFNIAKGDSGIPSFLSSRYLEAAYLPDMRHGPTFNAIFQSIQEFGFCNNEKRLNICRQKREYGVIIDSEFDFSPHIEEIEDDIQKRTQIPIFNGKTINIIPLVESLKLKFFIIEICDKDIATHSNPTINDIILTETEYIINCTGCEYQNHEVNLCLNLNKLKIIVICFINLNEKKGDINYLEFGENFSSTEGKSGIPLFFHGGSIETSWKQDFESSSAIDSIFGVFDKCYLELLNEGKEIDLIIRNSNLSNEQQEELQQLRIEQEKR
ncbi:8236_t:CDS:2, partial [Gigaspora rosea]